MSHTDEERLEDSDESVKFEESFSDLSSTTVSTDELISSEDTSDDEEETLFDTVYNWFTSLWGTLGPTSAASP
jgi:hypothetical protein